jgi:hypothetical protein
MTKDERECGSGEEETVTKAEAISRFCDETGVRVEDLGRMGVSMDPCDCGLPGCTGWLPDVKDLGGTI